MVTIGFDPEQSKVERANRKLAEKWGGSHKSSLNETSTHSMTQNDAKHNSGRVKHSDKGPFRQP